LGRELSFEVDAPQRRLSGVESDDVKVCNGSRTAARPAANQSLQRSDSPAAGCKLQPRAWTSALVGSKCASDRIALKADKSLAAPVMLTRSCTAA